MNEEDGMKSMRSGDRVRIKRDADLPADLRGRVGTVIHIVAGMNNRLPLRIKAVLDDGPTAELYADRFIRMRRPR